MSDDEFMARRADVHSRIVENEILEMDEFTGNPHTGDGIEEVGPLSEPGSHLGPSNSLVEPRERILRGRNRPQESLMVHISDFISH
ncbi:hypothetical protein DES43_1622 [Aquamicrobium defluvii]|uniref:Uncharacterized protein n=1 Tax=Aquamicrobium defluvii TaxID=69279 RepID=A0A4R6Y4H7_9HYPH|nr:hypothetical protein DES43_1622 [Aquamicrobium defluvii]